MDFYRLLPALLLCGCSHTHYEENGVVFDRTSYLSFTHANKFDAVHDKNGKLNFKLSGFDNDQVEAVSKVVEGAVKGAIQGAK